VLGWQVMAMSKAASMVRSVLVEDLLEVLRVVDVTVAEVLP